MTMQGLLKVKHFQSPIVRTLSVIVLMIATVGCARFLVPPIEEDVKLGAEVAKQVEEQIGLYPAVVTQNYIRRIGNRLVGNLEQNPFHFTFQIVDQAEPNAFAAPGGHIYVSRGFLALANSEDELAGVLGHEITHVTKRHSSKQSSKGLLSGLLTLPGRIVGRVVSQDLGNLINAPINTMGAVFQAKYGRGQEREADRIGIQLSAKSGYDPEKLADILNQLEKDAEMQTGEARSFSFFDSHPMTPSRTKEIYRDAENISWSKKSSLAKDKNDLLRHLDGLYYGNNPARGVFRGQKSLQPDLNFSITFPKDWQTIDNPSAVGAMAADQSAFVFLGLAGETADPKKQAEVFIAMIEKEFDTQPSRKRGVKIGSWPGYAVTYEDTSGKEAMYIHFLWVAADQFTYQLIGVGGKRDRENLRKTALSLRPMNSKERDSITGFRLRIATANAGESLASLSKRSGNRWSLPYTAMINDIPEDKKLAAGQLIKIAKEEPYRPNSHFEQ